MSRQFCFFWFLAACFFLHPVQAQLPTVRLDGVFPAGLPVGRVGELARFSASFAVARVDPAAGVERTRLLLVLFDPPREPVPMPEPERPRTRSVR